MLEKEIATHPSVLAWRIPGTGEPGGLPSIGLHRVGHSKSDLAAARVFSLVETTSFQERAGRTSNDENRDVQGLGISLGASLAAQQ